MKKVLFVCHGNICRSPMAEFIFKKIVKENGKSDDYLIESRATNTAELGNPVYPPSKRELALHGISCDGKYSVQITKSDYDNFDYIFIMDDNNLKNIVKVIGKDTENKVFKLLDYTGIGGDVPDPWYFGNYDKVYDMLYSACTILFEKLSKDKDKAYT